MKQDIESGDFMKKNHRIDEDVITEGKRAMTEIINRSISVALDRFEKL